MSKVYKLKRVQEIPVSLSEAWSFFSMPSNLQAITPPGMGFEILSEMNSQPAYSGQIIEYYVKPVAGVKMYWMTEITHVEELKFFVDEQRVGPYSMWHHQHHFKETKNGVEMTDLVHYRIPGWIFGDIAHALFVKNKLAQIFDYRFNAIRELWK